MGAVKFGMLRIPLSAEVPRMHADDKITFSYIFLEKMRAGKPEARKKSEGKPTVAERIAAKAKAKAELADAEKRLTDAEEQLAHWEKIAREEERRKAEAEAVAEEEEARKAEEEAKGEAEALKSADNSLTLQHGERPEQNNDERTQSREDDGGGVVDDSAGSMEVNRDRSDIRVYEEGLAAARNEHSEHSTRNRREAESERLVGIAKENGQYKTRSELRELGDRHPKPTGESEVIIDKQNGKVYKIKDPYAKSPMKENVEPEDAILEHYVHNKYFPETKYTFEGISDEIGDVRIILSQEYIESIGQPVEEQIEAALAEKGLKREGKYTFGNDEISVTDVAGDNALLGVDGKVYFIDPIINFKKPVREILGEAENISGLRPQRGAEDVPAEGDVENEGGANVEYSADEDVRLSLGEATEEDAEAFDMAVGLVAATGVPVVEVSDADAMEMMPGNKKTPIAGQPNRANEKLTSGSILLSAQGDSSSRARVPSKADAKIANDSQSAKKNIQKYNNGDFEINTESLPETFRGLSKLLNLQRRGGSRYTILRTNGENTIAVRLSDHGANGNNFGQDTLTRGRER